MGWLRIREDVSCTMHDFARLVGMTFAVDFLNSEQAT